jgi:hypothetical protein
VGSSTDMAACGKWTKMTRMMTAEKGKYSLRHTDIVSENQFKPVTLKSVIHAKDSMISAHSTAPHCCRLMLPTHLSAVMYRTNHQYVVPASRQLHGVMISSFQSTRSPSRQPYRLLQSNTFCCIQHSACARYN